MQEAHDAAADLEIIEVRSGTYDGLYSGSGKRLVWLATPSAPNVPVTIKPTWPTWATIQIYTDAAFDGFSMEGLGGMVAYVSDGKVAVINCKVTGGSGYFYPGAIYAVGDTMLSLQHCTLVENRYLDEGYGWGANAIQGDWNSRLAIKNSILWNPDVNGLPEIYSDGLIVVSSSIIRGGQYGASNQNPALAYGGWMTKTSPGWDAAISLGITRDAQGENRPAGPPPGPMPDLGWDEFYDADTDGLPDWLETLGITDPSADFDNDGLSNLVEYQTHLTNLQVPDSDGDGLLDAVEVLTHGTNPLSTDTDSDRMADAWEISNGLNPLADDAGSDLDNDGLTNFWEYTWGFDPADPSDANRDTDSDGLPDHWEINYYGHATSASPTENADNDNLTNLQEFQNNTEPKNWDTDGDLLPDGWEVQFNLNPRDATGNNGTNGNPDNDGLDNLQEAIHGSNPGVPDTDGDGTNDGVEVGQGGNPNDSSDGGQPPPPEEIVDIPFSVGDPSGSHSERWKLNIVANGPNDTRQFGFVSPDFGQMETQNFKLRRGNTYTITISHVATNVEEGAPDYDWEAKVDGQPNGDGDNEANHLFVVRDAWLVDNRQGLLTTEKHGDDTNIAAGRQAKLLPLDIDFIHPATGEMNEGRESSEGGYIAIRKDEETPVTKLKLHKLDGIASAEFKVTFSSSKIKIWKDAGRTQAVTSDSTLFPANVNTELFLEGLVKSTAAKDIEIGLKVKIGSTESSAVTTKATVVQSEYKTTIQAFLPYQWVDLPGNWLPGWVPGGSLISGQVAEGDNRGYDSSLTTTYRGRQQFILTPFKDLHAGPVKSPTASPGTSVHYNKAASVPQAEQGDSHGYSLTTNPIVTNQGVGSMTGASFSIVSTGNPKTTTLGTIQEAREGVLGQTAAPIRWELFFTTDVTNSMAPSFNLTGTRTGFPAFEIYIENSSDDNLPLYQFTPPTNRTVLSLFTTEQVTVPQPLQVP